jgi:type I restriction enzyme M protein
LPGQAHLRWSRFKNEAPAVMHKTITDDVFPLLRSLGVDGSTYSEHMRDARFTIPTPALLSKVVDMLDDIPMADRDTNGDLYEYLLSKIASAGVNGQFRTPRHIIDLMVKMTAPSPIDEICDPACGTAGFLVAASEYVRDTHPTALTDATQRAHFHKSMFHGYDFDSTMLRIGSMNMLLHGIEAPDIRYRNSLSEGAAADAEKYTLILANPPFAGSLDYESTSKDLDANDVCAGVKENLPADHTGSQRVQFDDRNPRQRTASRISHRHPGSSPLANVPRAVDRGAPSPCRHAESRR